MTQELLILNDGKLIIAKVSEVITLTEQTEFFETVYSACDHSATPVCAILDLAPSTTLPSNAISVSLRHPRFPFRHPNLGLAVVVAPNLFLRTLGDMGLKVGNLKAMRLTQSFDAAMEMVDVFFAEQNVLQK